jgi:DnaJ-class molecular chaperone
MANPYEILGVAPTATDDEIRAAYRKLAKAHHPDLNPGNKDAERRFKEIAAAYDLLGDATKRKRFDAGEIDETGAERPERKFYRQYAEAGPQASFRRQGDAASFEDLGDIFADLFGRGGPGAGATGGPHIRYPGSDIRYRLAIDFLDAVNGAKKRIDLPDGRTLDVTIPPGVDDGQQLRLAGMGGPGLGGAAPGDAIIEIAVRPHPVFRQEGTTIRSVLPVTLNEAINGGNVRVDTVTGPVDVKIPRGSNGGSVLRLRGKGVLDSRTRQRGDHLVELRLMLPETRDAEFEQLISDWETRHPYDPRKTSGGQT